MQPLLLALLLHAASEVPPEAPAVPQAPGRPQVPDRPREDRPQAPPSAADKKEKGQAAAQTPAKAEPSAEMPELPKKPHAPKTTPKGVRGFITTTFFNLTTSTCQAVVNGRAVTTVAECAQAVQQVAGSLAQQPTQEQSAFYPVGCYVLYGLAYVNAGDPEGRDCSTDNVCYCAMTGGGHTPSGGGGDGGGSSDGCGGGCIFLILFFVGGFVYFAAGMVWNHQRNEKRGLEMIPHVEFWKDVPFLVKDGVTFTAQKIRGGGGYSAV
eukprot:TRINITY_DN10389_c0_g1_i1.p2 TRINITY_DN10389_c0_g1~~TRINITY_DN10389_c0_g1_i1.p2  ORF type:complete len:266 (+),score=95.26 TRINITY_DN10389_c0_g1_i1:80-877(+)